MAIKDILIKYKALIASKSNAIVTARVSNNTVTSHTPSVPVVTAAHSDTTINIEIDGSFNKNPCIVQILTDIVNPFDVVVSMSEVIGFDTNKLLEDGAALTDSLYFDINPTYVDTATLSELLSFSLDKYLVDNASISEVLLFNTAKVFSESATVSEVFSVNLSIVLLDTVTATDIFSSNVTSTGSEQNYTDNSSATDVFLYAFSKVISDTAISTDIFSAAISIVKSEVAVVTDVFSSLVGLVKREDITLSEVYSVSTNKVLSELVTTAENFVVSLSIVLIDTVTATDIFSGGITASGIEQTYAESSNATDVFSLTFDKVLSEAITSSDVFNTLTSIVKREDVTATESYLLNVGKNVVENATLSEVLSFNISFYLQDTVAIYDYPEINGTGAFSASEAATTSDIFSTVWTAYVSYVENATATEIINVSFNKLLEESIILTDNLSVNVTKNVNAFTMPASETRSVYFGGAAGQEWKTTLAVPADTTSFDMCLWFKVTELPATGKHAIIAAMYLDTDAYIHLAIDSTGKLSVIRNCYSTEEITTLSETYSINTWYWTSISNSQTDSISYTTVFTLTEDGTIKTNSRFIYSIITDMYGDFYLSVGGHAGGTSSPDVVVYKGFIRTVKWFYIQLSEALHYREARSNYVLNTINCQRATINGVTDVSGHSAWSTNLVLTTLIDYPNITFDEKTFDVISFTSNKYLEELANIGEVFSVDVTKLIIENITATDVFVSATTKVLSDTLACADAVYFNTGLSIPSDTILTSETLSFSTSAVQSELATISEVFALATSIVLREDATVSEVFSKLVGKYLEELATIAESMIFTVGKYIEELATVSEVFTLATGKYLEELATTSEVVVKSLSIVFSDTVTTSEVFDPVLTGGGSSFTSDLSEAGTVSEVFSSLVLKVLSETTAATDSGTINNQNYVDAGYIEFDYAGTNYSF